MFDFCRKNKRGAVLLSLLLIVVSCGASINIHTCSSEGIKSVSINSISSAQSCGDCCATHQPTLAFSNPECCDNEYVSAYYKAVSSANSFVFEIKKQISSPPAFYTVICLLSSPEPIFRHIAKQDILCLRLLPTQPIRLLKCVMNI